MHNLDKQKTTQGRKPLAASLMTSQQKIKIASSISILLLIGLTFSCRQSRTEKYTFQITPLKDSVIDNYPAILLSTELTNNTKDTLKYVNMTCAWDGIYGSDHDSVDIVGPNEWEHNFPMIYRVNPDESFIREFFVVIKRKNNSKKIDFKISIFLRHFIGQDLIHFGLRRKGAPISEGGPYDIVWSNIING